MAGRRRSRPHRPMADLDRPPEGQLMRYEDFVIQIGRDDGDGHRLQVIDSPAGQGAGVLRLTPEIEKVRLGRGGTQTKTRRATPTGTRHLVPPTPVATAPNDTETIGEALFEALFSGQVRSLYDQSLGALGGRSRSGLRIKLKLDPNVPNVGRLQALPWELLRRPDTQEYLSLSRFSPIVRYLDVPRPPDALPLPTPLRLLVVVSNPSDLEQLDVMQEQQQLEALGRPNAIEVLLIEGARPDALRRALVEHEIHVIHFIGHGGFNPESGEGVLYLVGPTGRALPMSGGTLATLLRDVPTLRLAVLNACESARAGRQDSHPFAGVANALVLGGLPAVVAMQAPISDDAAIVFSQAFYRQLTTGAPIDAALTEGRQAMHFATPDSSEWSTPILFLRIADGALFQSKPVVDDAIEAEGVEPSRTRPIRALAALALVLVPLLVGATWLWREWRAVEAAGTELTALPASPVEQEASENQLEAQSSRANVTSPRMKPPPPPTAKPSVAESQPARAPAPAGESVLTSVVPFTSSNRELRGRLEDVVQLPDRALCWKLTLHNKGRARVESGFDLEASYLADSRGSRYSIVRADTSTARQPVIDVFAAGAARDYWMVFDPPIAGERQFVVFLRGAERGDVRFQPFRVELEIQVAAETPAPPAPHVPAGALPLATDLPPIGVRGDAGLNARVSSVMLFAADLSAGRRQSRMRWVLTLHNTTFEAIQVGLALPAIHLEDEYGNLYPVLASSAGQQPVEGLYIQDLQGGLRSDSWLEFPAPRPGVRHLKARFVNHQPARLQFDEIAIDLPEITATYRYSPEVLPFEAERGGNFGTSLGSLEARLVEVERLENGRLRWQLELRNEGGEAIDIGFDFDKVRLTDGSRTYRLLASDTGMRPEQVYAETIPAGGRVFHWLDFAEPPASSTDFNLILASHDRSYHYRPLLIELKP